MTLIISVTLWLVVSECNYLTWLDLSMALTEKHLVSRDKALRIFLIYFMHGIIFANFELVLVVIVIEILLTQMQLGGVQFSSHSKMILS